MDSGASPAVAGGSAEIVNLLADIERRSRSNSPGLPQQVEVRDQWVGVIFAVAGRRLLVSLPEVAEILHYPPVVTSVPGTLPWVRGIANVRGTLIPIVDLQVFLGGEPIVPGRDPRVLVIRHKGDATGLLVSNVAGMRTFFEEGRITPVAEDGPFAGFVESAFDYEGDRLGVFSMRALSDSPEFQSAAL